MNIKPSISRLGEICGNCGCTFGSHLATAGKYPSNYCPASEDSMDWDNGPGTIFAPTGEYKEDKE